MNKSTIEADQPEQVTVNEQKADNQQVSPSIANSHVVGSLALSERLLLKFKTYCEQHKRWEHYTIGDLICGSATTSNNEGGYFRNGIWLLFSGKEDKNGNDIYEHDILRYYDDEICLLKFDEYYGWSLTDELGFDDCNFAKLEIIGNKYDNPELLQSV